MVLTRRSFWRRLFTTAGLGLLAACGLPPSGGAPPAPSGPPVAPVQPIPTAPGAPPAPATPPVPSPAPPPPGLPLFDTHVHYSQEAWGPVPVDLALALMERAGTRLALVSSTPDEGTIRLHQAAPSRIIPILRPYRTRDDMATWHQDRTILPYLEERLGLGVHRGIGEFHLSGEGAETPVVAEVVRLATARGLILHAHADERALAALLAVQPRARVLWAHAGFADPSAVGAAIERYPTLSVELAIRDEIGSGGQLSPDWRALFERHADRITIGTDSYVVSRWMTMPAILGAVRAWLVTLPAAVGEAIAWRNAARLFGVPEAIFRIPTAA